MASSVNVSKRLLALRKHAGHICGNPSQCDYPACSSLAAGEHLQYGYAVDAEREAARIRAQHDCSQNAGAVCAHNELISYDGARCVEPPAGHVRLGVACAAGQTSSQLRTGVPPPQTAQFCSLLYTLNGGIRRQPNRYCTALQLLTGHSSRVFGDCCRFAHLRPPQPGVSARHCDSIDRWRTLDTACSSVTPARTRTSSASCIADSRAMACRASSTPSRSAGRDNWGRALERAIGECEQIVFVLSPDFCKSEAGHASCWGPTLPAG
jgi:hypothetical protein